MLLRGPFLEAPGNYRTRQAVLFFIKDGSFKSFEDGAVKLSANETKWTSLEVIRHPTFLETLISKYNFRPVKLTGLSRNGPLVRSVWPSVNVIVILKFIPDSNHLYRVHRNSMVSFVRKAKLNCNIKINQALSDLVISILQKAIGHC